CRADTGHRYSRGGDPTRLVCPSHGMCRRSASVGFQRSPFGRCASVACNGRHARIHSRRRATGTRHASHDSAERPS
ncbi:MAG: hypothetical protein ACK56F_26290, partial [bacterium]